MKGTKDQNIDSRITNPSDQKVETVVETTAGTGTESYNVSESKRSGGKLKQEVAAQVVAQGKGSGYDSLATPAMYGKKAGSYSGDGRAVLGNMANTPVLPGDIQGKTREGKKLSDPNKDINNMVSEQYATFFEQPKALAQDREATVGYNGNPSNISARSQKNSGFTPAELLYDRSVDEIRKDHAIFVSGQNINVDPNSYPQYTGLKVNQETGATSLYPRGIPFSEGKGPVRGNFMPQAIVATFKKDSSGIYLSSFEVDETDLSVNGADHYTVNDSSAAATIDVNRAELTRQRIDNSHGSPTSDKYNPLGRSVLEPSSTMLYLMDMEATTGAVITSAIRHAVKSKAYYLTRVGKDGLNQNAAVIDALYGHLLSASSSTETTGMFSAGGGINEDCPYFSTKWNRLGSAAVLLRVFDSLGKYKTKADVVNQPRGLKLPLSTGLNNYSPFHVSEEFIKALNAIDVFSTIDRGYDPSAPTMISDGLAYILPYSWKRSLSFTRRSASMNREYSSEILTYSYQAGNGNQRYYIKVADPILNGIAWFLEQYATSFYKSLDNVDGVATIRIPVRSYSTKFSLFDYLLCASLSYIQYERTNTMKDILDEELNFGYPFDHLHGITDGDVLSPLNYGALDQYERLSVKEMRPSTAMRWIMPEVFTPIGRTHHMLPWPYCQSDFEAGTNGKLKMVDEPSHFPAPVIRSGVALSYLDDFYGMTLKDQMLCLDKMSCLPGSVNKETEFEGCFYKYGVDSEGLVLHKNLTLSFKSYASTPRQLGWVLDLPYGICQITQSGVGDLNDDGEVEFSETLLNWFSSDNLDAVNALNSSFRARAYSGAYGSAATGILDDEVVEINRGQAFAQKWAEAYASTTEEDSHMFNVSLSIKDGFTANAGNDANDISINDRQISFKPYTDIRDNQITDIAPVCGFMKVLWARIQKMPFVINPFDAGSASDGTGVIDPFDFAYMFGLAGFMGVTYFEEMSNRMSDKYAKMFNFVEDPYFKDSPLFN